MAYTRSKKAPKKAKTRARKLALAGSARPRARPSAAAKRSTTTTTTTTTTTRNSTPTPTTTADVPSDTDEDLLDAANSLVTEVGKLNRSLEKPKASFWKKHGSNIAVVIRRMPSFDRSRYQRVDDDGDEDIPMDNAAATPPSSYKKVRFDRQVEQIGSSGGMSGILTAAKFGDEEDEEPSSSDDTDEAELSEDELSESVRRITRSSVNPIKPRNHGFAVVIKKSPAVAALATPTPGAPRVTRHSTTTRHQFRLAVTGNPAAAPSSMTTTEAVSVRSLIHSRIDDKYAASRTRATASTIAANRSAASKASNAKRASTFTAGVVQKDARAATVKRTSGRIAAKASKAKIVHINDDDDEEEEEEDSDE
ncbi:uncharacterized protein LAJ45_02646 [Morchella importuna]|uniref:uncharacterized protein n=1 Tax=Morchella importuna TaxID=1174673 RepID=UPI001E8CC9D8|nr:uncharacterized protein LAJ45_02646 [Morchella importuna]KAH8153059.1 hypothetical protein LAJ45_02646 [Morchella importuna]